MPPATLNVAALAPEFDHGLTITRPSPATSSTRNSVNAADAMPPARIAPHDTADLLDSSGIVWIATTSDMAGLLCHVFATCLGGKSRNGSIGSASRRCVAKHAGCIALEAQGAATIGAGSARRTG